MKCLFLISIPCAIPSCLLADNTAAVAETTKPNVVLIFVDDLRTSLGCYGDPLVKSPEIDRLANESRLFLRAYCHQAVCGPSRTSILTGRLPDNTGVWHNRNRFRDNHPTLVTLPQLFKNSGYHTQGLGKIFSGDEREEDPLSWTVPTVLRAPGWNNYALTENRGAKGKGLAYEVADVADDGYPDGRLANLAIEKLAELKQKQQPFLLAVGFFRPHLPFNAPKKYWDLYDPTIFALDGDHSRANGAPDVAYPDHLELAGYREIPEDERLAGDQARTVRHGYYACISYVDAQVGKLLDALRRLQLDDNTIVVLLGDHGYSLGEADHWCKDTNFELDTHVPLIIRTPGLNQPGAAASALTEYVDIYPTLAALAGLSPPTTLDGRSLVPILNDPQAPGHAVVLSQFSRPFKSGSPEVMGYSIRTDSHRYTRWIDWDSKEIIAEELYDYTTTNSVLRQANLLIEHQNLASDTAYAPLQEQHSRQLDAVIRARLKPGLPESTEKPNRKRKQP